MKVKIWKGERSRPLRVQRPCDCGCDSKDAALHGVGYLTWSNEDGVGVTVWIPNEDLYKILKAQHQKAAPAPATVAE